MKVIRRALKTKLDLTPKQETILSRWCGVSRFIYNWALEEREREYKENGKGLSYPSQNKLLTAFKKEYDWMSEPSKWVLQDSLRRLDNAYTRFFDNVKKSKKSKGKKKKKRTKNPMGFPQFKRKSHHSDSFTIPMDANLIRLSGNKVKLPKIGYLRTNENLEEKLSGKRIIHATVSQRKAGGFWISVAYEEEIDDTKRSNINPVGVDFGVKTTVTLSNGKKYDNPKHYKLAENKIGTLSRWMMRKPKGSKNREKSRIKLAKSHERVTNLRTDFLHKLSTELTKEYTEICIEDLNIEGMLKNHKLAKSIWSSCFGILRKQLEYKCEAYRSKITVRDQFFPSSKLCNECGEKNVDLKLSDRDWVCLKCGVFHDRDTNAAINILTGGYPAITPLDLKALACSFLSSETLSDELGTKQCALVGTI